MKQTRNFWPFGIIAAFTLFGAGTAGLVCFACMQKVDLVSSNYYEQELKFQGQIERLSRTSKLGHQASVAYDRTRKIITISLPAGDALKDLSGRIHLYRPSAASLDRELPLALNPDGIQILDASTLRAGLWKVRVSWSAQKQDYFIDQKVVVGS